MDDDLGTPAAMGVVHDTVREGNKHLQSGDEAAAAECAGRVRAMLSVLGLDPHEGPWDERGADGVVDALVAGMLEQRAQARAKKDFGAADAIRDTLAAAGVEVEDTPNGPRWSLS